MSARTMTATIDGGTAEKSNAKKHHLNTLSYSDEKGGFGIEGYRIPMHGLPPRNP